MGTRHNIPVGAHRIANAGQWRRGLSPTVTVPAHLRCAIVSCHVVGESHEHARRDFKGSAPRMFLALLDAGQLSERVAADMDIVNPDPGPDLDLPSDPADLVSPESKARVARSLEELAAQRVPLGESAEPTPEPDAEGPFVVVTVYGRPDGRRVVHAWGEQGMDRRAATNLAARMRRADRAEYEGDPRLEALTVHVCQVMGERPWSSS